MNSPKITIVVPSFNQIEFLEKTLISIVNQHYQNLELIVIDGGSKDGSVEIIKKYAKYITYWVSEPDGGQTNGLIKGFNRSSGEIQCWLNSDDLLEIGALERVANYFTLHPNVDAVFGNTVWIDAQDRILREHKEIPFNRFIWMYTYNYIPGMSMFWRKSLYEKVGGLNSEFNLAMDADLWIRFSQVAKIGHVNEIWSRMRFYSQQKNRRLRDKSNEEDWLIRSRYWGAQKPSFYALKRAIAQLVRVVWKLIIGSYSIGYKRYLEKI